MKIAFTSNRPTNLLKHLRSSDHEVRVHKFNPDNSFSLWNLKELCDWADLIWCDSCIHPTAQITNYVTDKPIVVRLNGPELYDPKYMDLIKWDNIEILYASTKELRDRFLTLRKNRLQPKRTEALWMPSVDTDHFGFVERDFKNSSRKICLVGDMNPNNKQLEALQLLTELPDYTLSFAGTMSNLDYVYQVQNYIKGNSDLKDRVEVYGKIEKEVMSEFYGDHDLYLKLSVYDSGFAAEAMATGCFPVIGWGIGVYSTYPSTYIHTKFTKQKAAILDWQLSDKKLEYSKIAREYAEDSFSSNLEYDRIIQDLEELCEDSACIKILS
jgi:glycosyltransferase involved in cell wall biosynthesis